MRDIQSDLLLNKLVLICLLTWIAIPHYTQESYSKKNLDSLYSTYTIDSLEKRFGYGKSIPKSYQYRILLALSYYPELDSTTVIFKERKIKTTLNTRPTFWSLLSNKRKYIIRINTNPKHPILLKNVPFNASIGLMGHEFAHILDYQRRTFFGIFKRAIDYTSSKRKTKFEKEVDSIVIEKGLGWQLFDWSYYVLHISETKEKYKSFKRTTYLTPEEIKEMLKRLSYDGL